MFYLVWAYVKVLSEMTVDVKKGYIVNLVRNKEIVSFLVTGKTLQNKFPVERSDITNRS